MKTLLIVTALALRADDCDAPTPETRAMAYARDVLGAPGVRAHCVHDYHAQCDRCDVTVRERVVGLDCNPDGCWTRGPSQ